MTNIQQNSTFKPTDFTVFLALWNKTQQLKTPLLHYRIAKWLQDCWINGDQRLLLMAFRAAGKSTLVGLFSTWILWRDPDLRFLVLAADHSLASKMVTTMRTIIQTHPLTKHLRPKKPDKWASHSFTVNRPSVSRDPSVLAAGITSNITGTRADIIIYDDVEVPNTCDGEQKREGLRERLRESNYILTPGGTQLFVGTPHSYFSIYAETPRTEIDEERPFLHDFKRLEVPILDENGNSAWEERYPLPVIDQMRAQSGETTFTAQMMLKPINMIESRLNTDLLHYYDTELTDHLAQQRLCLFLGEKKITSCSAWWDPAFGTASGDSSVLAIIFTDEDGMHYLHDIAYIRVNSNDKTDEATQQCQQIVALAKKYFLPAIHIESNGLGKFLPNILRRELAAQNIPCAVIEKTATQNKADRILSAFETILAAKRLSVHQRVRRTPFIAEMIAWQPYHKNARDDGLDAVAGALLSEPERVNRTYNTAKPLWTRGYNTNHKALTDYSSL